MPTRSAAVLAVATLIAAVTPTAAHDMFLKPESFFPAPGAFALPLLNGTFGRSENAITRDRVREVTLAGPAGLVKPSEFGWEIAEPVTRLGVTLEAAGTWVVGVSLQPRELRLEAKDFNAYLREEGLGDMLELRRERKQTEEPARERYSKHVKAVLVAGQAAGSAWREKLGYPVEIVPASNPAGWRAGQTVDVLCLVDGRPTPGLVVMFGGETPRGRAQKLSLVADAEGRVRAKLPATGSFYFKFIDMKPVEAADVDYESRWATLTFGVR
jgi:hypothetical protein